VECVHERPGTVQLPGADPQEGGLSAHNRDTFGQSERLRLGGPGFAGGGVTGLRRGVGVHRLEHHPGIREGRLFSRRRGQARQPGGGVGPAAQQVEHQPPRRGEEQRPRRLLAEQLQSAHLPVHRLHVERLARNLQPPQVCLQPHAGIQDMGGDIVEPGGQRPAHVKLVGSPVDGKGGVKAVRHQLRGADALRTVHRFVGELDSACGAAGVRPAAGQCRRQTCPCCIVGRPGQHVIELGRQLARLGPEQVDRGGTEHRLGPPVEVILSPAASRRLVIQTCRDLPPAGRTSNAGAVEEIADSGRVRHHTSS
jgi:hypothetical protein